MTYTSYIHITNAFVEGLAAYLKKKDIPLDEVVEVFAGNGALGLRLGLKADRNISDSLLYAEDGYEDDVNVHWDRKPPGVVPETAYETVLRFHAKERAKIRLLIMGAPLPALSTYCPSYEAAKALHYLFDASMLYIGEMNSLAFASPKFFRHVEIVEDDPEQSFQNLVYQNYDSGNGYFASEQFDGHAEVHPYLLKFVPCTDEKCDCRDDANIRKDVKDRAPA